MMEIESIIVVGKVIVVFVLSTLLVNLIMDAPRLFFGKRKLDLEK